MTGRAYIRGALSALGLRGAGQSLTGEQLSDALLLLNEMMRSWRGNGLLNYAWARYSFAFAEGQATRTIGPSGQWDTATVPRPLAVEDPIGITPVGASSETPCFAMTREEYRELPQKDATAEYPTHYRYEPGAGPLGQFTFYPVPTSAATFHPTFRTPLAEFENENTDLTFPDGYDEAIRTNLALKVAPDFNRTPSPLLIGQARRSLMDIQARNIPLESITLPPSPWGSRSAGFDIRTYK